MTSSIRLPTKHPVTTKSSTTTTCPQGSGAYFNIQHYYAPGTQWALECYFYNNGSGYLSVGGVEHSFSYPANTWFHVENDIDLDLDSAKLIINDVVVAVWPFSYQQSSTTGGINQLGSINFYAGAPNNGTGTYYVDNFSVTELTAAAAPNIVVTPDEDIVLTDLDFTTTTNYSFSINNTGDAPCPSASCPHTTFPCRITHPLAHPLSPTT